MALWHACFPVDASHLTRSLPSLYSLSLMVVSLHESWERQSTTQSVVAVVLKQSDGVSVALKVSRSRLETGEVNAPTTRRARKSIGPLKTPLQGVSADMVRY
jgi:hypothetical protein